MKNKSAKMLVTIICVMTIIVYVAGCEEQNSTGTDTRKTRLIASENIELKRQLEKCQADLAKEKELRAREEQEHKAQAEKYQEQIKQFQGQTTEFLQQQIESFVGALVEETAKLKQENEALLERIKELEK